VSVSVAVSMAGYVLVSCICCVHGYSRSVSMYVYVCYFRTLCNDVAEREKKRPRAIFVPFAPRQLIFTPTRALSLAHHIHAQFSMPPPGAAVKVSEDNFQVQYDAALLEQQWSTIVQ